MAAILYTDPSTALLNFDGPNGSSSFPDVLGNTWSAVGAAALSNTQQKFGPTSLLLGGSSDLVTTSANLFAPGTADWTFEAFVYANNLSGSRVVFGSQGSGFSGILCFFNNGDMFMLCGSADGSTNWSVGINTASAVITTGSWYHAAWVRYGSVFTMYLNGTAQSPTGSYSGSIIQGMTGQAIGSANASPNSPWAGFIDEARITMGKAVYTANFTPPSAPFVLGSILELSDRVAIQTAVTIPTGTVAIKETLDHLLSTGAVVSVAHASLREISDRVLASGTSLSIGSATIRELVDTVIAQAKLPMTKVVIVESPDTVYAVGMAYIPRSPLRLPATSSVLRVTA